jgi:Tol biopolymer transport system component
MMLRLWSLVLALLAVAAMAPAIAGATFPGVNGTITFERTVSGQFGLYVMNPDGSNQRLVIQALSPATLSPDGTKLLFSAAFSGAQQLDLYTINIEGTGLTRVTDTGPSEVWPSWSPDGTSVVAWDLDGAALGEIVTFKADGSGGRFNLTQSPSDSECCPEWSPDGSRILFVRDSPAPGGSTRGLFTLRPDGTDLMEIPTPPGNLVGYASWAPDATRLAVQIGFSIYTLNSDGTNQRKVLDSAEHPAWSPDGTKLLVVADGDGQGFGLHTSNVDGTRLQRLTPAGRQDNSPDWAPSGPLPEAKNASKECSAERERLGDAEFTRKYGGGANAFGKCVGQKN